MKKSDKSIILMLVGILLAAASYFLVYKNLTAETETMQKANAELRTEVEYLQELADNKQKYIDDTAAMQIKIDEIKAQFPAQYLPEDDILYMIEAEDTHTAVAKSINMGATTVVEVAVAAPEATDAAAAETAEAADETTEVSTEETAAPDIMLYRTPVTANVLSGYKNIKDILKQINTDKNRKSIDTLTISFDSESGELFSTIGMSMYSLTGTEAVYTSPKVDGVVYGTDDIFNSAKQKAAVQAQRNAAMTARE